MQPSAARAEARDVTAWSCMSATSTARIDAVWRIESRTAHRRARAHGARRRRWPRSWRRTRWSRRSSSGRATRRAGQPGRLADGDREAPRDRPPAPRASCIERKHEELGRELDARRSRQPTAESVDAALDDDVGDDLLRLDVHRLPPGALDRGARRADAAPARRPDHRRDRARLPRAGADHRAAHRARQAHAGRGAGAVRGAARRRARRRGSRRCSR